MADPTNTPTATAPSETEASRGKPQMQGSSENQDRSLTSPEPPKAESTLEKAVRLQQEFDRQEEGRQARELEAMMDQPIETPPAPTPAEPPQVEPQAATEPAPPDPNREPDDSQADEDGMQRDDKGRFVMRPARGKKLLEKAHRADELEKEVENLKSQLNQLTKGEQPKPAKPTQEQREEASEIDKEIDAARAQLKKAKEDYDTDAEIAAQEKLIDLRGQKKALEIVIQNQELERAKQNNEQWERSLDEADDKYMKERDQMWSEDQDRVAALKDDRFDLRDQESPFYQAVVAQLQDWKQNRHPILRTKGAPRRAVEIVAESMGVELPPTSVVVKSAPAAPVKSGTVQRRNAAVTSGGAPAPAQVRTQRDLANEVSSIQNPMERLSLLASITEAQAKSRNAMGIR